MFMIPEQFGGGQGGIWAAVDYKLVQNRIRLLWLVSRFPVFTFADFGTNVTFVAFVVGSHDGTLESLEKNNHTLETKAPGFILTVLACHSQADGNPDFEGIPKNGPEVAKIEFRQKPQ